MNKAMLDYKNTMALLFFFSCTVALADISILSRLKHSGSFIGLHTGFWRFMHSATGSIFIGLTLAHLAYRKDKIMFIKECMMHKM